MLPSLKLTRTGQNTFIRYGPAGDLFILSADFIFFFNLLIGWHLSIWISCKLFFSMLYNCPLLCSWRLALIIVVEVFPWPIFLILPLPKCLQQTHCAKLYALSMNGVYCLKFFKVAILLSPFEKLPHSLFYLSILFLTFFSNTIFQIHL